MRSTRSIPLLCFVLCLAGCTEGNPSTLLEVKGWMRHAGFTKDGQYLYALHSHLRSDPLTSGTVEYPDSLVIWDVDTWEKVLDYKPPDKHGLWWAYSSTDPDVIIYAEDHYPDESLDLVWHAISTGEELGRLPVDTIPWDGRKNPTLICDHEENIAYMDSFRDRVVAVDGTDGTILREYPLEPQDYRRKPFLNKEDDRLTVVDAGQDVIYVFRLSTGELLGSVDVWPGFRQDDIPVASRLIDKNHILYVIVATNDLGSGIHFFEVDLDQIAVTGESLLAGYTFSDVWLMEDAQSRVLIDIHLPTAYEAVLVDVDYKTGQVVHELDSTWQGQGQVFPIPSLNSIYLDDWRAKEGTEARIYSYPEFQMLHKGHAPNDSDEKIWVSNGQFIVMSSYFSERFGVYDPVRYKVLDDFHICEGAGDVGLFALQVDPTERWASVICAGNTHIDREPGVIPNGAGVAVVDLDRYR